MPAKVSGKKPYQDPLRPQQSKVVDDPLRAQLKPPKPYKDPLRARPKSYKSDPIKLEYKPYTSFHVFKPSNIDPLTGRPYRSNRRTTKKEIEVLEPVKDEPSPEPKPEPKAFFPVSLGSTAASIKRTLYIVERLDS